MKLTVSIILLLLSYNSYADCTHEQIFSGFEVKELEKKHDVYVELAKGSFEKVNVSDIHNIQFYNVQASSKSTESTIHFGDYNETFIEYYEYHHIKKFIGSLKNELNDKSYISSIIGKSVEGRDLYRISPKTIDKNKKTIIMFGRHHGDEGTANWIIEGFTREFLKETKDFHEKFQLILYPMVNPDGAKHRTRYNANSRDLNRSWDKKISKSYDEAKIIHQDLKPIITSVTDIPIVLDMHGSFTEDFIYRVKKKFAGINFYREQQSFIDQLGSIDSWQNSYFKLSNGHPKMARIVLVKNYELNALTHETIRNIPKASGRDKDDLFTQGKSILEAIAHLY